MPSNYKHELTDTEIQCGVTLEMVQSTLVKGVLIEDETKFVVPKGTPPALASSTARCAFAGQETDFLGFNSLGCAVYGVDRRASGSAS